MRGVPPYLGSVVIPFAQIFPHLDTLQRNANLNLFITAQKQMVGFAPMPKDSQLYPDFLAALLGAYQENEYSHLFLPHATGSLTAQDIVFSPLSDLCQARHVLIARHEDGDADHYKLRLSGCKDHKKYFIDVRIAA